MKKVRWRRICLWSAWAVVAVVLGAGTTVLVSWRYAVRYPSRTGWIPFTMGGFSVHYLGRDYCGFAVQSPRFAMVQFEPLRSELYTSALQQESIANWPPIEAEQIPGWVYWPDYNYAFEGVSPEKLSGRLHGSYAYGWPRLAMKGMVIEQYSGVKGKVPAVYFQGAEFRDFYIEQNLTLPLGIIPRGFAINTGFYGAVWFVVGGVGVWGLKRVWNRRVERV